MCIRDRHPPGGDTRRKKCVGNLQKIVEERGRTGKKGAGWYPQGGDTRVKAIKSDSDSDSDEQKSRKVEGWHPQLLPRVSHTLVTPTEI